MRRPLVLTLLLLLAPALAAATQLSDPAAFHVLTPIVRDGHHVHGVLVARALTAGTFEFKSLGVDRGSLRRRPAPPRARLAADSTLQWPFDAELDDTAAVFEVQYTMDGDLHGWRFSLAAFDAQGDIITPAGRQVRPGSRPAPAPPTRAERTMDVRVASVTTSASPAFTVPGERDITVHGRVVYSRPTLNPKNESPIPAATLGVEGVTVSIYHNDGLAWWYQTKTETNADGSFSQTFHWVPLNPLASHDPNIVLRMDLANDHFYLRNPVGLQTYSFTTGTWNGVGSDLDAGGWTGPEDQQVELDLLNNLMKGRGWYSSHEGYSLPAVGVLFPEIAVIAANTGSGSWYSSVENAIHLATDRSWDAPTHLHEYGHFFIHNYGNALAPDYCNGVCDGGGAPVPTPWACGHCFDCAETDHDAWNEGWADWIAEVQTLDLGLAHVYAFDTENAGWFCKATNSFPDPMRTEGPFEALLRDIWDPPSTEVSGPGPAAMTDELSLGTHPIFQVTTGGKPVTVAQFLNAFSARFPQYTGALYSTERHNNFPQVDFTPPPQPANVTSSSHAKGVTSTNHTLSLSWDPSVDDKSGLACYWVAIHPRGLTWPDLAHMRWVWKVSPDTTFGSYFVNDYGQFIVEVIAEDRDGNRSNIAYWDWLDIAYPTDLDLQAYKAPGWADSTVARGSNNATTTNVPGPATQLTGGTASTWWNMCVYNTGPAWAPNAGFGVGLYVDGQRAATANLSQALGSHVYWPMVNAGPVTVPGGRHSFVSVYDDAGTVNETNERNNASGRQYLWSPTLLTPNTPALFAAPGKAGALDGDAGDFWFNSTGLRMTAPVSSWWNLVWTTAWSTTADYDCRIHWTSNSPDTGFGANLGWSGRPAGRLDAVLVNRNTMAPSTWDISVINTAGVAAPFLAREELCSPFTYGDSVSLAFGSNQLAFVRELYVSPSNVGPLSIVVREPHSRAPLHVALYDRTFTTGALLDAAAVADMDTTTGVARLDWTVPATGYYGVVVWVDPIDAVSVPAFTLQMRRTLPDLKPALFFGWHSPLVPRPRHDATTLSAALPDTLYGDSTATWLNYAFIDNSPTGGAAFTTEFDVDGVPRWMMPSGAFAGSAQMLVNGAIANAVAAGRHTLTMRYDMWDEVLESREDNNTYGEQYVWGARTVTDDTPISRGTPPDRVGGWTSVSDSLRWFDCDGWRTPRFVNTGNDGFWGGAAIMPTGDADLRLHEIAPGSKNGFGASLALSAWGPNQSDFALVNFNRTAFRAFDVGVLNGTGGATGYLGEATRSRYTAFNPNGIYGPWTFDNATTLRLHEVYFYAGSYLVDLLSDAGTVDWGVSVYGPSAAVYAKSDAIAASWSAGPGIHESVGVTITVPGYYCIAAWRATPGVAASGTYRLNIHPAVLDAPAPQAPSLTLLSAPNPNPFRDGARIPFTLARDTEVTLGIYDLRGARLRTLASGARAAGSYEIPWDGRDERGHPVVAGLYLVRLESGNTSVTRKVIRVE
jgi:hypothetical protein